MARNLESARRFGLGACVWANVLIATAVTCTAQVPNGTVAAYQQVNGFDGIAYGVGDSLLVDGRASVNVPAAHPGAVTFFLEFYLEDDATPPNRVISKTPYAIVSPGNSLIFGDEDMLVVPGPTPPWWYYGEVKVWHVVDFTNVVLDMDDYYFAY